MENLVDKIIEIDFDELDNEEFPLDEFFGLTINYKNRKHEFLIRFASENKNLICFGSGFTDIKPPVFNRHSWQSYFKESVIYFNDPTLYVDERIKLGWGVGNHDEYYLEDVAELIKKLCKKHSILNRNILFYGSSGGGFMSIQLATMIQGSTVLVNNAQLIVNKFPRNYYKRTLRLCFNGMSEDAILEKYGYRFNVVEMFKKENYIPNLIYLINIASEEDLHTQCIPFVERLKEITYSNKTVEILTYSEKNDGHGPLNKDKSIKYIKKFAKERLYNGSKRKQNNLSKINRLRRKVKKILTNKT